MHHEITLFGEVRCPKTRFYQAALEDRGLPYEMAEVDRDESAAQRLIKLTGSPVKFPTFQIKGRKVRNPKLADLDKELARADLYDPGLIHDARSKRFVRHMAPSDAFVSYSLVGDERMIVGHIEVDPALRGTGVGRALAVEVLEYLETAKWDVRLTCPFMRKIGATRPEWRKIFGLGD